MDTDFLIDFNWASSAIIECLKEGVIILSHNLNLIYLNKKAREIYQQLEQGRCSLNQLPTAISDLLTWLSKNSSVAGDSLIMDYQLAGAQNIRVRVHSLDCEIAKDEECGDRPWLLLFLEDRNAILQDEMKIEQKKYNLTNRELQVLNLLSQSYTYQEVSETLKITINTVKFHAKNIHLKKQIGTEGRIFIKL